MTIRNRAGIEVPESKIPKARPLPEGKAGDTTYYMLVEWPDRQERIDLDASSDKEAADILYHYMFDNHSLDRDMSYGLYPTAYLCFEHHTVDRDGQHRVQAGFIYRASGNEPVRLGNEKGIAHCSKSWWD